MPTQEVPRAGSAIRHNQLPPVDVGGSGGSNVTTDVVPAVALAQRFDITHGDDVAAGVAVAQGALAVTVPQAPAVAVSEDVAGVPVVDQAPALALTQRFAVTDGVPNVPAANLVQVTYALNRRVGANVVDNIGPDPWTNPTNAQGLHDASNATMVGDVLDGLDGILRCAYLNLVNDHTQLAISAVNLHYYVQSTGTVANNGHLALWYRVDGTTTFAGATLLELITGNVANLSTPRTFDITAAVGGDWSKIDALVGFVRGVTDTAEQLINYACTAVELEVVAAVTDAL